MYYECDLLFSIGLSYEFQVYAGSNASDPVNFHRVVITRGEFLSEGGMARRRVREDEIENSMRGGENKPQIWAITPPGPLCQILDVWCVSDQKLAGVLLFT